jgi:hypothetical protein
MANEGASAKADRATAAEPIVSALRDGIPSAWSDEPDGSVVGYMCLTDWEFEIGNAAGGTRIHGSITDLERSRKCVAGCGIMEVRVVGLRVVRPCSEEDDWRDAQAIEARQRQDAETGLAREGESAVRQDAPK